MEVLTEPIVGYRAWQIVEGDEDGLLFSFNSAPWEPGNPVKSRCSYDCKPTRGSKHSCGIYALRDSSQLMGYTPCGEVYLWGNVHVHEMGYRAEYAYPKNLYLYDEKEVDERTRKIARVYGCELVQSPFPYMHQPTPDAMLVQQYKMAMQQVYNLPPWTQTQPAPQTQGTGGFQFTFPQQIQQLTQPIQGTYVTPVMPGTIWTQTGNVLPPTFLGSIIQTVNNLLNGNKNEGSI